MRDCRLPIVDRRGRFPVSSLLVLGLTLLVAGCHQDMWNQPRANAQLKNDTVFSDGSNSRQPVVGAVAFGKAKLDREFYTGFDREGHLVKEFPVAVNEELLKRGQDRFRIFCTPCHGELGNGKGFIAERGFTQARPVGNYQTERLRKMPVGHFFDVITNGYGTMYPFRSRIKPYDRWAIASYIRVLQASQYTAIDEIPTAERTKLESLAPAPGQNAESELPIGQPPARELNVPGGAVNGRQPRTVPIGRSDRRLGESPLGTVAPTGNGAVAPGGNGQ